MSTYNNQESKLKDKARYKIHNSFKFDHDSPSIFSMPANNFYFEKQCRDRYPNARIDTVEGDYNVYKQGRKIAKTINANHKYNNVFTHLAKSKEKYDLIWLDLCGNLTPSLITNLIPIVQGRNTKDNALIAITLAGRRENKIPRLKEFYEFESLKEFREIQFIDNLKSFAKMNKVSLKYKKLFQYQSDNGMPMNLYILTLKNLKK